MLVSIRLSASLVCQNMYWNIRCLFFPYPVVNAPLFGLTYSKPVWSTEVDGARPLSVFVRGKCGATLNNARRLGIEKGLRKCT